MGSRYLKLFNHYNIFFYAAVCAVALYASPQISEVCLLYISTLSIEVDEIAVRTWMPFICVLVCFIMWFLSFRSVYYEDKTGGRSYRADHVKYKLSYGELLQYFKSGNHRIDLNSLPDENWRNAEGIILGHVGSKLIKRDSDAEGNLAVFALPGSGKTTAQIIPSALRFNGSVFCIDIKGDVLAYTRDSRPIKVFNLDNFEESSNFDPFSGFSDMNDMDRRIAIEQMAYIIVEDDQGENSLYFTNGARDFFCGIALYLLSKNLNTSFQTVINAILLGNAFDWVKTIRGGECAAAKEYTDSYFQSNEKNVAGCYNKLCRSCRPFTFISSILGPGESCITPQDLDNGTDVYILIPPDKMQVYAAISTMITQQFLNYFYSRPDRSSGTKTRNILMLLDEFCQLNFGPEIAKSMAVLRSKGVSISIAAQSIAQLQDRFGREGAREIIDTCKFVSIMSAQDPESCLYFQRLVGSKKELNISTTKNDKTLVRSASETWEPVFQPEDFSVLNDKVVIVINGEGYAVADKCYCYRD